jgi:hypothetical protein
MFDMLLAECGNRSETARRLTSKGGSGAAGAGGKLTSAAWLPHYVLPAASDHFEREDET